MLYFSAAVRFPLLLIASETHLGLDLLEEREEGWMSLWPDGEQAKDDGPESGREETAPIISDLEQNGSYLKKTAIMYRIIPRIIRVPKNNILDCIWINGEW
jgi:hypothetical protein